MITFKKFLVEKIVGNTGWVYHRTKENPESNSLFKRGIDSSINSRGMYGRGLYSTYDIESQLNQRMIELYGNYIIKGKINLDNMVILDKEIYDLKRVKESFDEYLKSLNLGLTEKLISRVEYTSDIAIKIYREVESRKYSGLIFTGRQDGRVAVVYNKQNFIPYMWSEDNGLTWKKIIPDIKTIKTIDNDNMFLDPSFKREMHSERKININLPYIEDVFKKMVEDGILEEEKYLEIINLFDNVRDNQPWKIKDIIKLIDRQIYNRLLTLSDKEIRNVKRGEWVFPTFTFLLPFKSLDLIEYYVSLGKTYSELLLHSVSAYPQASAQLFEFFYNNSIPIPRLLISSILKKPFSSFWVARFLMSKNDDIKNDYIKQLEKDPKYGKEFQRIIRNQQK
jgi:hypothetical protein